MPSVQALRAAGMVIEPGQRADGFTDLADTGTDNVADNTVADTAADNKVTDNTADDNVADHVSSDDSVADGCSNAVVRVDGGTDSTNAATNHGGAHGDAHAADKRAND